MHASTSTTDFDNCIAPALTSGMPIAWDDIVAAHTRIRGVAIETPVFQSRTADLRSGGQLVLKCENLQRAGAFKFRGAYNALAQFTPEQRARGAVTASSGNHAQAIGLAARLLGMRALVLMPEDAPAAKIAATRGYGAEIVFYDRYTQDRETLSRDLAELHGMTLVPPFDHPHVMAGQGTVAKELFAQAGALDVLLVPLGGGGLLSGCAVAAHALHPGCRVVGVEPETGNDGQRSFRTGRIVHIDTPKTIADGAQTQHLGMHTFPVIRDLVHDIVTVSDSVLIETTRFLAERMKLIVEPTGCLAVAAALHGALDVQGRRVGVVLSGGNVDLSTFASLIA